MIGQKTIDRRKSKEFIGELVRYVLTAKGKKNLEPKILKKYMTNVPLDIEFWSQYKMGPKLLPICIENNYPYEESYNACFKKSEAKKLWEYTKLILQREDKKHMREMAQIEFDLQNEVRNLEIANNRIDQLTTENKQLRDITNSHSSVDLNLF